MHKLMHKQYQSRVLEFIRIFPAPRRSAATCFEEITEAPGRSCAPRCHKNKLARLFFTGGQFMNRTLIAAAMTAAIAGLALGMQLAVAQQTDAPKAADKAPPKAEAKKEEEPFWAVGRPKGDVTA